MNESTFPLVLLQAIQRWSLVSRRSPSNRTMSYHSLQGRGYARVFEYNPKTYCNLGGHLFFALEIPSLLEIPN